MFELKDETALILKETLEMWRLDTTERVFYFSSHFECKI